MGRNRRMCGSVGVYETTADVIFVVSINGADLLSPNNCTSARKKKKTPLPLPHQVSHRIENDSVVLIRNYCRCWSGDNPSQFQQNSAQGFASHMLSSIFAKNNNKGTAPRTTHILRKYARVGCQVICVFECLSCVSAVAHQTALVSP